MQLNIAETHVENDLIDLLVEMRVFRFRKTLKVIFCKEKENNDLNYSQPIYFSSETQIVRDNLDIDHGF